MPDSATLGAFAQSSMGEWVAILSLVFGGCCSNVWALEAVLNSFPSSGTFLTFAQFLYVALQTVWTQFYFPPGSWVPRFRRSVVPISRWMVQVVLFVAVSLMNNYAFGLKIPLTVHIIFRSGGLCVSMLTGYFLGGKRYSAGQIFAGVIITVGIVIATISAPRPKRPSVTTQSTPQSEPHPWLPESMQYPAGIALLSLALFLSAWLGLWQERTYAKYGKQWREALFYCHTLSLPFFFPMHVSLTRTFNAFLASPPITLLALPEPHVALLSFDGAKRDLIRWREIAVPRAFLALAVNVITQGVCIRGVNRLTTRVSSTTVNLVLTLRKAASLAISVWYYGSGVSSGLVLGGAMVLGGTMIYSMAPPPHLAEKGDKQTEVMDKGEAEAKIPTINGTSATSSSFAASQGAESLRHRS